MTTPGRARHLAALRERLNLGPASEEARDQVAADRGERLAALLATPVWLEDILPLMERLYGTAHRSLLDTRDPTAWAELVGYQHALEDLLNVLGGSMELGRAAMQRIAVRRFGDAARGTLRDAR